MTIQQASRLTGVSAYSIRYYDQRQLIPGITRDQHNQRLFSATSLQVIRLIACLRQAAMPLTDIKRYLDLLPGGTQTMPARYAIMQQQQQSLLAQLQTLQDQLTLIETKMAGYEAQMSTTQCVRYAR